MAATLGSKVMLIVEFLFDSCKGAEDMLMGITGENFGRLEAKMAATLQKILNEWADVEFLFKGSEVMLMEISGENFGRLEAKMAATLKKILNEWVDVAFLFDSRKGSFETLEEHQ
eukprot:10548796-Lingulodinium_polyedra.AAC.1